MKGGYGYVSLVKKIISIYVKKPVYSGFFDCIKMFNDLFCMKKYIEWIIDKEEEIKGIKLSRTTTNGMYIHLNTTNIEDYNKVSLLYEKLVFIKEGEEVVKAIPESIELDIKFVVEGKGKNKKYILNYSKLKEKNAKLKEKNIKTICQYSFFQVRSKIPSR